MPVNPYEGLQQAAWGGKALTVNTQGGTGGQRLGGKQNFGAQGVEQANTTQSGGRMGGRPEQANTSRGSGPAPTENVLKPTPQASSRQNTAAATMGAPDYGGYKAESAPSARKAAFGGNAGNQQRGNGFNITTGDITIGNNNTARGGRGGTNNLNGDGNTVGDNSFSNNKNDGGKTQVSGRDSVMGKGTSGTPGRRRITPVRRTGGPAGPAPAGPAPAGPTPPAGGAPAIGAGGKAPAGGAPTPATPAIAGGKAPLALGTGTAGTSPTVPTSTEPKAKPTREEKIAEVASRGSTAGERSAATAAQGRISGAPKGPVGQLGSGTDAEQTSNFKGLQGNVSKSATAGGAKEPMNQSGQGSAGMPTAQSTSGGAMANLEKNKAKSSSPTTASAPEPTNASGTKKDAPHGVFPNGMPRPAPATGDAGKIGPRMNPDGTEDKTKYAVGGQPSVYGAAGKDSKYRGVQPAAIQPDPALKNGSKTAKETSAPPAAAKEKVKTAAKKKVEKAVSAPPTNASAKKKSKGPVEKTGTTNKKPKGTVEKTGTTWSPTQTFAKKEDK